MPGSAADEHGREAGDVVGRGRRRDGDDGVEVEAGDRAEDPVLGDEPEVVVDDLGHLRAALGGQLGARPTSAGSARRRPPRRRWRRCRPRRRPRRRAGSDRGAAGPLVRMAETLGRGATRRGWGWPAGSRSRARAASRSPRGPRARGSC